MIAPLAKSIDWLAFQVLTRRMPCDLGRNLRLEEALRFLKDPDFIPKESQPARVDFNSNLSGLHFHSPTPRPCDFTENNVVYGRLYRCGETWQKCPAIILLHGWNSAISHRFRFPWIARHCNQAGFNVATLQLPYHFQRRPRQPGALSPDYLRLVERTAQAVAEIRGLTGWLLGEGCPAVVLWGSSYGAWLAGLTVCHDARPAAAVMAVPSVRSSRSRAKRIIWRRSREILQRQNGSLEKLDMTSLNLTTSRPVIPKENILLIEAVHDLFATKEPIEDLWQAWGQPDIWRLPHGHFSFGLIGAPRLMANEVLSWLSPRLNLQSQLQPVHPASP